MNSVPNLTSLRKNLKEDFAHCKPVSIALLGDSATQLIAQALKGYGFEEGLAVELFEGDYDQIDLQIIHPASELYEFQPAFTIIHKTSQKLLLEYYKSEMKDRLHFAERIAAKIESWIQLMASRMHTRVILSNFPELTDIVFGNYASKTQYSFLFQIRLLNVKLMELAQQYEQVFINDVAALQHRMGAAFAMDRKVYINSSMPESIDFIPFLAKNMIDIVQAVSGKIKKCLILDLDNTSWGGVIGDDGLEGIQIGGLGIGKAFTELQSWAKNLKDRGIILGVCSKNTDHIAREPFEKHPEMVLRMDDISIFVANWENKADNIRHIQQVLNIGFDSMVFLDDNPFERNLVRSELPEVTVPELPEDPALYLSYLQELNLFETASFSTEDAKRTLKYKQEAQRVELKQQYGSIDDYLSGLEMKGSFLPFDSFHTPRIAQLSQRSNQFNLRTVRYDEQQIKSMIDGENKRGFYVKLADKFGEYGLISILILEAQADAWFIDTWIMSCRVLKRGVEKFVLNQIVQFCQETGKDKLIGEYLPTPKNALVENHYQELGFGEEGGRWVLKISEYEGLKNYIDEEADGDR